ncbi:daptide-type RiPP biosynthesis methyltransferase [Streptomyces sp. NPDC021098]|uniref:daptide-type RiPP biosynthesis methyltransferase n=1 Tax=unclassified Streptomyces TaxID=2593676 RepID=UPI00378ADA41
MATPFLPGRAGERVAQLGDRARLCGLYDEDGSGVYDDLAAADGFEIRDIITAVRTLDGPVLDLAAGSGRFTLPLLALGRDVTALDMSPHMLGLLTQRLARTPERVRERCTVVQADMSGFTLGRRFAHVLLGTTSLSLLDTPGRAGLYRCVADHLSEGGQFLVSILERGGDGDQEEVVQRAHGASGTPYDLYEYWPTGALHRAVTIVPADPPPTGRVVVAHDEVPSMSIATIEGELHQAGFTALDQRELTPVGQRHRVVLIKAVRA